jgi:cytochrome P450
MLLRYDPFDPEVIADPYPHYARLRDEAPCYHNEQRGIWVLSRYDDVSAALRNTRVFSSNQGVGYEKRPVPMMIAYDPPQHTRLRRIVSSQFTPRQIAQLRPRVEQIAASLLDPLLGAGTVDWVDQVALPLPVSVIAELMGVPPERRADFKRWSSATVEAMGGAVDLDPQERMRLEGVIVEFAQYFMGVIEERRAAGGADGKADDLISLLLRANRDDEERLQAHEIVSFCVLLLVAGNETTTSLMGNGALALLEDPAQWKEVREDPQLVPALIEEALRYDSPIQGFFRNTLSETQVAGRTIPADSKVMVLYGSANRDPRQFEDPDVFRVRRHPEDHLAFGAGPHVCLGAQLARLEAEVLVRCFLERARGLRREGDPVRTRNPLLRGLARLPVQVIAR